MMSENRIEKLKHRLEVAELDLALLKELEKYDDCGMSATIRRADGTEGTITPDFIRRFEMQVESLKAQIEKLGNEGDGR